MNFEKAYKWLVKEGRKEYLLKDNYKENKYLFFKSAKQGFIFEQNRFRENSISEETFLIKDIEEDLEVNITKKIFLKHNSKFYHFKTLLFDEEKEKFYKCILPSHPKLFDFLGVIEEEKLSINISKSKKVLVVVKENYDNDSYSKKRLTIKTYGRVTLKAFKHIVNSIILSLGYLTGSFLRGEKFYFQSDNLDFSEVEFLFRNSQENILSYLKPISNNIKGSYDRFIDHNTSLEKFNSKITTKQFEVLVNKVFNEKIFYLSLSLIRDTVVSGVLTRPIILYPAFESLCKTINQRKINEKDKILKEYRCLEILKRYKDEISQEDFLSIKDALKPINTPVYQNTFIRLGQEISEEDRKVFCLRNKLLHGSFTTKTSNRISNESDIVELNLLYLSYYYHIYTLISRIILQEIGFKGYVIQQHQLRKNMTNQNDLEEKLFIEIK